MRSSSVRGTGVPNSGMPGTLPSATVRISRPRPANVAPKTTETVVFCSKFAEGVQVLDGAGDRRGRSFGLDGGADQLELERARVAGGVEHGEELGEGKVAVAGHDAVDHRAVEG